MFVFLFYCSDVACKGLLLGSFLIKPIQRFFFFFCGDGGGGGGVGGVGGVGGGGGGGGDGGGVFVCLFFYFTVVMLRVRGCCWVVF